MGLRFKGPKIEGTIGMRKTSLRLRLLLALICLLGAAIGLLVATGRLDACALAVIGTDRQVGGPLLCKFEFFLNRYQTLVGSLIALGAALYAVSPVWRQLRLVSVQAATDLLPHLHQEASEIAADVACLASASKIENQLRAALELGRDPQRPSNVRVGDAIGMLESIGQSLFALKQAGTVDQFANRITLTSSQRQRRQALASIFDDIWSAHDQIMKIVKPPGGMPIAPYYEQIAPKFSDMIEANIPGVLGRLENEIRSSKVEIQEMHKELHGRTELAIRTSKEFVG